MFGVGDSNACRIRTRTKLGEAPAAICNVIAEKIIMLRGHAATGGARRIRRVIQSLPTSMVQAAMDEDRPLPPRPRASACKHSAGILRPDRDNTKPSSDAALADVNDKSAPRRGYSTFEVGT
jgi:hypothetical protein